LCFRVAHTLSDSDVPPEFVRYDHVDLIVHSLRAMEEHKHLATSWKALLLTLEDDEAVEGQGKLVAVKQRVALRMFLCSADIEGQVVSDASPLADCVDPYRVAALRTAVEELDLVGTTSTSGSKKSRGDEASMEALNGVLLEKLPTLLANFKGDATILRSLTSLPQHLRKSSSLRFMPGSCICSVSFPLFDGRSSSLQQLQPQGILPAAAPTNQRNLFVFHG
jgi:hypothetical protein